MKRDYYDVLGVSKNADEKEIRSAYRRLARKYHPDVNRGSQEAEGQFKEINEAHETLSDPEKRRLYDLYGANWRQASSFQQPGSHGTNQWGVEGMDPRIFTQIFGGGSGDIFQGLFNRPNQKPSASSKPNSRPIDYPVELTLEEAFTGTTRAIRMNRLVSCLKCNGSGVQGRSRCDQCSGAGTVPRPIRGEVTIPAGVETGSRVRVAPGGQRLTLVVKVSPSDQFVRRGSDLSVEVLVPLFDAILGGEVLVLTLTGQVALALPPETQNGKVFRLVGQGMPRIGISDTRGDLYATIRVQLPDQLTDDEREGFHHLKELRDRGNFGI